MKFMLIEKRKRKGTTIALLKNKDASSPEPYVVARDYDNDPLDPKWGHGIYFNDLLKSAKYFEHITKGR